MKVIATQCPICSGELVISRLSCTACETRIETELAFSSLMRLPDDLREFVMVFLRCRGNIREVEKELGISYPTVCKRLDLVNEVLAGLATTHTAANGAAKNHNGKAHVSKRLNRGEILARLERGEITAKEASDLLKGR